MKSLSSENIFFITKEKNIIYHQNGFGDWLGVDTNESRTVERKVLVSQSSTQSRSELSGSVERDGFRNAMRGLHLGISLFNAFSGGRENGRNRQTYQSQRYSHYRRNNGSINRYRPGGPKRRNNERRDAYARNHYGAGQHPAFMSSRYGYRTPRGSSYYRNFSSNASPSHWSNAYRDGRGGRNLGPYYHENGYVARQNSATRSASYNHRNYRNNFSGGFRGLMNNFKKGGKNQVLGVIGNMFSQMEGHLDKLPKSDQRRMGNDLRRLQSFGEQVSGSKFASMGGLADVGEFFRQMRDMIQGAMGNGRNNWKPRGYFLSPKNKERLRNFSESDYQKLNAHESYMIKTYKNFSEKRVEVIYENIKKNKNGSEQRVNEKFVRVVSKMSGLSQYSIMDKIDNSKNLKDLLKVLNIDSKKIQKELKQVYYVNSLKIINSKFATV